MRDYHIQELPNENLFGLEMPFTSQNLRGADSTSIEALLHKLENKLSVGELLDMKVRAPNLEFVTSSNDADKSYTYEWALNHADVTKLLYV